MGLFRNAFRVYLGNLRVSLWFALLLVFTGIFPLFFNMIYSSGTIFLEYTLNVPQATLVLQIIGIALYLLCYSFFLSMIVFGVRKELSTVRVQYYFAEVLHKIVFKLFAFMVLYVFALLVLSFVLFAFGVPTWLLVALMLLLSLPTLFVPQVIVVEELPVFEAVAEAFDFMKKHWMFSLALLVLGSVVMAVLLYIELLIDQAFPTWFAGRIVTLLVSLLFLIPFLESLKTYFYMMKFGIIKSIEELHSR